MNALMVNNGDIRISKLCWNATLEVHHAFVHAMIVSPSLQKTFNSFESRRTLC